MVFFGSKDFFSVCIFYCLIVADIICFYHTLFIIPKITLLFKIRNYKICMRFKFYLLFLFTILHSAQLMLLSGLKSCLISFSFFPGIAHKLGLLQCKAYSV